MKKFLLLFSIMIIMPCAQIFSQAPQGFSYQAVIRDGQGAMIDDQVISLSITIKQVDNDVYIEHHKLRTSSLGLVSLTIGSGVAILGNFENINWGLAVSKIQLGVDITGGTNFSDIGESQLLSVPYALYANQSANSEADEDTDPLNEIQDLIMIDGVIYLSGKVNPNLIDLSNFLDNTDNQTLERDGQNIHISNGNYIVLPDERDPEFSSWDKASGISIVESQISDLGNYEPAFTKKSAFNKQFGIYGETVAQGNDSRILNGQAAFDWDDHSTQGYLTTYTETDPEYTAWDKSSGISITESQISDLGSYETSFSKSTAFNKDFGTGAGTVAQGDDSRILNGQAAFDWDDHSTQGYLTTFTETDPEYTAWDKSSGISITESQISDLGSYETSFSKSTAFNKDFGTGAGTVAQGDDSRILNGQSAFDWDDHSTQGYLTTFTETDPEYTAWDKSSGISITESQISDLGSYETSFSKLTAFNKDFGTGAGTVAQGDDSRILNGQSAFDWDDHSTQGYMTTFTETDPEYTAWDKSTGISITESQISDLGSYETSFSKLTAFNKDFGTGAGTVAQGDDSRILNGESAFGWGDHSTWTGSSNLTTLGTIATGIWQGTAIAAGYIGDLPTSKITSGIFDNARINWAAPGGIGGTTASSAAFTTLAISGSATLGDASGDLVTIKGALKIESGTPGDQKYLGSDASGNATWNAIDKSTVGLNNVDNTSDATKNSATATLTNKTLSSPKINENVVLTASSTELNFVDGVTSSIQTQIDGKVSNANHTGDVTGSTSLTIADNSVDGTDIEIGSDAQGDIMYYDGTDWVSLPAGTSGQVLKTNGTGSNPSWTDAPSGNENLLVTMMSGNTTLNTESQYVDMPGTYEVTLPSSPSTGQIVHLTTTQTSSTINLNGKSVRDFDGNDHSSTSAFTYYGGLSCRKVSFFYNGTKWIRII